VGHPQMWTLEKTSEWDRRFKYYEKKHQRELIAALDNLDTFVRALNSGIRPRDAKFGFIHPEPLGVLAIDQKGGGRNLAETRLYTYPDEKREALHLIIIGDKNSQKADIATCMAFVQQLRTEEGPSNGKKTDTH
jgi:hypothetical protein